MYALHKKKKGGKLCDPQMSFKNKSVKEGAEKSNIYFGQLFFYVQAEDRNSKLVASFRGPKVSPRAM